MVPSGVETELREHHAIADAEMVRAQHDHAVRLQAGREGLVRACVVVPAALVVEVRCHHADDRSRNLRVLGLLHPAGDAGAGLLGLGAERRAERGSERELAGLGDAGLGEPLEFLETRAPEQPEFIHAGHDLAQDVHGRLGSLGEFLKRLPALKLKNQGQHLGLHRHGLGGELGRISEHHDRRLALLLHPQGLEIADVGALEVLG